MKMNKKHLIPAALIFASLFTACSNSAEKKEVAASGTKTTESNTEILADRFADIQVLRYDIPGFSELSLQQKQLAYYLYEAGLSGRDMFYDQKNKNNLCIRKTLETILSSYSGDKNSADYAKFLLYSLSKCQ